MIMLKALYVYISAVVSPYATIHPPHPINTFSSSIPVDKSITTGDDKITPCRNNICYAVGAPLLLSRFRSLLRSVFK